MCRHMLLTHLDTEILSLYTLDTCQGHILRHMLGHTEQHFVTNERESRISKGRLRIRTYDTSFLSYLYMLQWVARIVLFLRNHYTVDKDCAPLQTVYYYTVIYYTVVSPTYAMHTLCLNTRNSFCWVNLPLVSIIFPISCQALLWGYCLCILSTERPTDRGYSPKL